MIGPGQGLIYIKWRYVTSIPTGLMLYLVKIILVWTVGMLGTWHRANSGDVYLQIFNLCLRPLHIVLGPGPGSSQYCVSPHQEKNVM